MSRLQVDSAPTAQRVALAACWLAMFGAAVSAQEPKVLAGDVAQRFVDDRPNQLLDRLIQGVADDLQA